MSRRSYTSIPSDFPVCIHQDCPMATACLHQIAYSTLQESEHFLCLINPRKCQRNEQCKFFRDAKPVPYAYGFTGFQQKMLPQQYKTFMNTLIMEFGRNTYFAYRRGETPLPPKLQQTVVTALHKAGITEDLPFDRYEEQVNYYD